MTSDDEEICFCLQGYLRTREKNDGDFQNFHKRMHYCMNVVRLVMVSSVSLVIRRECVCGCSLWEL